MNELLTKVLGDRQLNLTPSEERAIYTPGVGMSWISLGRIITNNPILMGQGYYAHLSAVHCDPKTCVLVGGDEMSTALAISMKELATYGDSTSLDNHKYFLSRGAKPTGIMASLWIYHLERHGITSASALYREVYGLDKQQAKAACELVWVTTMRGRTVSRIASYAGYRAKEVSQLWVVGAKSSKKDEVIHRLRELMG